jgi:hypothetical protein
VSFYVTGTYLYSELSSKAFEAWDDCGARTGSLQESCTSPRIENTLLTKIIITDNNPSSKPDREKSKNFLHKI